MDKKKKPNSFSFSLPMFLYIKPPDESTLGELLPDDDVWTEGLAGPKTRYLDACEKLVRATDILYVLQKNLVEQLLDNDDTDDRGPSSRKIFITNLRKYVVENSIEHRVILKQTKCTIYDPFLTLFRPDLLL